MCFFLNLIFSVIYANGIGVLYKKKKPSFGGDLLLFSPILLLWLLICSTQYYVGTDYGSYMDIFHGRSLDRYEPGFLMILKTFFYLGFKGQVFYLLFYSLSFIFLILIFRQYDLEIKFYWILIILYICVSNLFNNQLNGLRQAVGTYIGTFGFLLVLKQYKYQGFLIILLASSIHLASLIYALVLLTPIVKKLQSNFFYALLACGFLMSLTINVSIFYSILKFLPTGYANYIIYKHLEHASLSAMVPKYIYIPFYVLSIKKLPWYKLTFSQKKIFDWGILSFTFKLCLLGIPTVSRITDFFLILSLYPLYCLLKYYAEYHKYRILSLILLLFISLYFIKTVIFPSAEYSYKSMIGMFF